MPTQKYHISLLLSERKILEEIADSDDVSGRYRNRAGILLDSDEGVGNEMTVKEISEKYSVSEATVINVRRAYIYNGIASLFENAKIAGRKKLWDRGEYSEAAKEIFEVSDLLSYICRKGRLSWEYFVLFNSINNTAHDIVYEIACNINWNNKPDYNALLEMIDKAIEKNFGKYNEKASSEKAAWVRWWIIRYYVREDYKRLELTPLCLSVRTYTENDLLLSKPDVLYNQFIEQNISQYIKRYFGKDGNIGLISNDRINYYSELTGKLSEYRRGTRERADMLSLVSYLDCFSVYYDKNLKIFFGNIRASSAYNSDDSWITRKVLYDVSLALDASFIASSQQVSSFIGTTLYRINKILQLIKVMEDINRKTDAIRLCSEISEKVKIPAPEAEEQKFDVLQKFYLRIMIFDIRCRYGIYDAEDDENNTELRCPNIAPEKAYKLFSVPVRFAGTSSGLKAEIISIPTDNKDTDCGKGKIRKKLYSLPFIDINRSGICETDYDVFFGSNVEDIMDLCLKAPLPETYKDHFSRNFHNNRDNIDFYVHTVLGEHTDGLSVFICCYLYFALMNVKLGNHSLRRSINKRSMSFEEIQFSRDTLSRLKSDILRGMSSRERDSDTYEAFLHLRKIIFAIFEKRDINIIAAGLSELLGQLISITRPYYAKHSIELPFEDDRFKSRKRGRNDSE